MILMRIEITMTSLNADTAIETDADTNRHILRRARKRDRITAYVARGSHRKSSSVRTRGVF